jgi:hypothetical protein
MKSQKKSPSSIREGLSLIQLTIVEEFKTVKTMIPGKSIKKYFLWTFSTTG